MLVSSIYEKHNVCWRLTTRAGVFDGLSTDISHIITSLPLQTYKVISGFTATQRSGLIITLTTSGYKNTTSARALGTGPTGTRLRPSDELQWLLHDVCHYVTNTSQIKKHQHRPIIRRESAKISSATRGALSIVSGPASDDDKEDERDGHGNHAKYERRRDHNLLHTCGVRASEP